MSKRMGGMTAVWMLMGLFAAESAGQVPQTEHTLKLEEKAARPKATMADVKLLERHWKGDFLGAKAEELWLPPAGGAMAGVSAFMKATRRCFTNSCCCWRKRGASR